MSSSISHSDAVIFGYGAVSGLIDKYATDYNIYGYSNRDMCIAMVFSTVFSVGETCLGLLPQTSTVSNVLSVASVYTIAEEAITFVVIWTVNYFY